MNREQALRKVLACLRMAESATSNPHEAAAAMRQAQALMQRYGLDEGDLAAGKVAFESAPTRQRGAVVPQSLACLAEVVANTYSCRVVQTRGELRTQLVFAGSPARARVAAYAFAVLRRVMDKDRLAHTRRVVKRDRKAARGEQFALGWVAAVRMNLPKQEMGESEAREIDLAIRQAMGEVRGTQPRQLTSRKGINTDSVAGFVKGTQARVAQGLEARQNGAFAQLEVQS